MRPLLLLGFLVSLMFADVDKMVKKLEIFKNSLHSQGYIRGTSDLPPYEASKYIGGYAIVHYQYENSFYEDTLRFSYYDNEDKVIIGTRTTDSRAMHVMICGKLNTYDLACLSGKPYSEYNDWYFLNFNGTTISGDYYFGTSEGAANAIVYARYQLKPLYGTFYPKNVHSSSSYSYSSSSYPSALPIIEEDNTSSSELQTQSYCESHGGTWADGVCLSNGTISSGNTSSSYSSSSSSLYCEPIPGQSSCYSFSSSSSVSSLGCESNIEYGSVEDYENEVEEMPGASNSNLVYTKEVVGQIIEHKLEQCRQDPKSCGINAIPIITETSDPNEVLNQVKNKSFPIKGYYLHYGNSNFDWLYVPISLRKAYKLEKGVTEDYYFRWTRLPNDITITKEGNWIRFTK
ncbi:hypothetical protein NitYY0826_P16 (plasmid) [Nitratiruptor sp. YY08-26]|uniref:hypothetical protein n=1 Tax=unclassified Nitratiruptor TaxID=2624044 RepID=UPI0018ED85EE|nr:MULTISPECIES: hypothetical protein [unclassified Nitratiruptor]BCD63175.1 hypothetical protein NitYY0813_P16 [Nitratiruptor sp. YY08-13]BCD67111.1 hypothetical protein NitYY0826_P16 [Nitratiruptor sp. YY08-26]